MFMLAVLKRSGDVTDRIKRLRDYTQPHLIVKKYNRIYYQLPIIFLDYFNNN